MKLLIAIVNNEDSAVVSSALTKEGFSVTKLSTTGGFLMVGNTTFLIGAEDDKVQKAKETRTYSICYSLCFINIICRRIYSINIHCSITTRIH